VTPPPDQLVLRQGKADSKSVLVCVRCDYPVRWHNPCLFRFPFLDLSIPKKSRELDIEVVYERIETSSDTSVID
jgi:hypothetical protein